MVTSDGPINDLIDIIESTGASSIFISPISDSFSTTTVWPDIKSYNPSAFLFFQTIV